MSQEVLVVEKYHNLIKNKIKMLAIEDEEEAMVKDVEEGFNINFVARMAT